MCSQALYAGSSSAGASDVTGFVQIWVHAHALPALLYQQVRLTGLSANKNKYLKKIEIMIEEKPAGPLGYSIG